jgi:DNA-binding PadR family transcriptional regulator
LQQISLTPTSYIVLGLLRFGSPATPYDLKVRVNASLSNFWSVPHSQLYAEPDRLLAAGLVSVEVETGGRRRKAYSLTSEGAAALDAWLADATAEPAELRDPALLAVFFGADRGAVAAAQLPRHEAKLAEFEALAAIGEAAGPDAPQGPLTTLRAGIAVERAMVAFWKALL